MVGICDTDIHLARGYMAFRGVLGHEFVGLTPDGRRVTSEINFSCGSCDWCTRGEGNHCPNRTVLGILNHDGAMADWVCVPTRWIHDIPDILTDEQAVFIEPLAAAFRIPEEVELAGRRVAVLGDGKLGILCAWVAQVEGAEVTLIGRHPEKLALAGKGIRTRLSSNDTIDRYPIVIDATGSASGLTDALNLVEPRGTVVLKTTMAEPHSISLAPIVINEIRVIGSRCGPFPRAIEALVTGEIDVRTLIEQVFALSDAEAAFKAADRRGALKVLVKP
jgi:threonine dehydrogenase-like Zn-dependent dehydrogenase